MSWEFGEVPDGGATSTVEIPPVRVETEMPPTAELQLAPPLEPRDVAELAQRAVDLAWSRDARLAVAESCTAGAVAAALAMADGAGACFQGGVVAFSPATKYSMLGVQPGPVISHEAARQMARGALERFDADVAVATTGVLGPGPRGGRSRSERSGSAAAAGASPRWRCARRSTGREPGRAARCRGARGARLADHAAGAVTGRRSPDR